MRIEKRSGEKLRVFIGGDSETEGGGMGNRAAETDGRNRTTEQGLCIRPASV